MTKSNFNAYFWFAGFCGLLVPLVPYSAPGNLAQSPLFTATSTGGGVPSNIFFQLDDSGSMDWEYLTKKYWDSCLYQSAASDCSTTTLINDGSATGDWRNESADMNILYYNPNVTYVPWKIGDGTSWANAPVSVVPSNFSFEVWTDSKGYTGAKPVVTYTKKVTSTGSGKNKITTTTITNQTINISNTANGMVDLWDRHITYTLGASAISATQTDSTIVTYTAANPLVTGTAKNIIKTSGQVRVETPTAVTIPASGGLNGRNFAQEKQNIANWYKYYRNRLNVAKGAIGQVIDSNPNYRYGLNTIWNTSFVEVPSKYDPVNSTTARTDFITPNKSLLATLYAEQTDGKTPLPNALDRAGKYFKHSLSYADPIVYECQQNFAILFTDGYWNEALSNTSIADVDGDGRSKTLADVARYYYNNDLNTALADKVPTNLFDAANWQHMVTFTVAFGLSGNLVDSDGDGWPNPGLTESSNWGNPSTANSGENPDNIDDLWHAAFNAKGKYVSASSPEEVSAGFSQILENISQRDYKGTAASASFNTSTLSGSNTAYMSQFSLTSSIWSGDLLAFTLDPATGAIGTTAKWKAASLLDNLSNRSTARHIFTYNRSTHKGVPFQWTSLSDFTIPASPVISEAQKDLGTSVSGAITTGTHTAPDPVALARLTYLRGDTSNEGVGYQFRKRSFTDVAGVTHPNILGDIIHSAPVLVTAPRGNWPARVPFLAGTTPYRDFKNLAANKNRTPMVFVGANDGMLHAFNANTGAEAMAYIPETLFSSANAKMGLHYLTDPNYSHRYYVDMPPVTEDVVINGQWRSVLIGGLMAGGKGIFALDITNPSIFGLESSANAQTLALWEFNSNDDPNMGYSYSIPSLVMMNNGKWAAVFGNGYNSSNGKAQLFILFLDGGLDGAWTKGTDYIVIEADKVGGDCSVPSSGCNGLSSPQVVDTDFNRTIDRIYAGDLKGNMWAFDVSDSSASNWKVAYGTSVTPAPLFTATYHKSSNAFTPTNHAGKNPVQQNAIRQPITTRPQVLKNRKGTGNLPPNVLVLFGTGQYLTLDDTNNKDMQSFYGVWDNGTGSLTPASLIEQAYLPGPFYDQSNPPKDITDSIRVLSKNAVIYDETVDSNYGWLINLPKDATAPTVSVGERQVVDTDILDEKYLFFNTWIPGAKTVTTPDSCTVQGNTSGSGFLMSVDLYTGGEADSALFDLNGNGVVDELDTTSTGHAPAGRISNDGYLGSSNFLRGIQHTGGTEGGHDETKVKEAPGEQMRRRSWQEMRKH